MHISSDRWSFEYFVLFYNPTVSPSAQECEVVEAGGIKALWLRHHRNSEADIRPGLVVMGHLETKSFNYNATTDFYFFTLRKRRVIEFLLKRKDILGTVSGFIVGKPNFGSLI